MNIATVKKEAKNVRSRRDAKRTELAHQHDNHHVEHRSLCGLHFEVVQEVRSQQWCQEQTGRTHGHDSDLRSEKKSKRKFGWSRRPWHLVRDSPSCDDKGAKVCAKNLGSKKSTGKSGKISLLDRTACSVSLPFLFQTGFLPPMASPSAGQRQLHAAREAKQFVDTPFGKVPAPGESKRLEQDKTSSTFSYSNQTTCEKQEMKSASLPRWIRALASCLNDTKKKWVPMSKAPLQRSGSFFWNLSSQKKSAGVYARLPLPPVAVVPLVSGQRSDMQPPIKRMVHFDTTRNQKVIFKREPSAHLSKRSKAKGVRDAPRKPSRELGNLVVPGHVVVLRYSHRLARCASGNTGCFH